MDPLDIRRTRPAETNAAHPLRESASQTAGPYVHIGCLPNSVGVSETYPDDLTTNKIKALQNPVSIRGQVFEGEGIVCKDIMLEFWQADSEGDYAKGIWHRAGTDLETGFFEIRTVLPGGFCDPSGRDLAPFINVWVTARGINIGLLTRIYFPGDAELHRTDPHLALVPGARRATLLARQGNSADAFLFDIHLQGDAETVFFDV